ncbi:MAG TPA: AraC family transcriptional regulator [Thermoanaerobaculia bacterium]|nr:AraC family transcriptional regulator [Thermoanaerobaculia bacterium]
MHRAIEAMKEHLDRPFELEQMAEVAMMSPFHFHRVFRDATGIPPHRFLTALRVSAAKRLLASSDLSVTDISLEVGYSSLGTFTRRFKELVGTAPMRFRELAGGGAAEALPRLPPRPAWPKAPASGLAARLATFEPGQGPVFVGLFRGAVPQGAPAACALVTGPERFRLGPVPDGTYHLLAMGLAGSAGAEHVPGEPDVLLGGPLEREVTIRKARPTEEDLVIHLRLPEATDPPILTALPLFLASRMSVHPPS